MGLGGAPEALQAGPRQGFEWGYLDLLTPEASGIVLIWSWGLPFMPGTVGRGRAGDPVDPSLEPSVCVAVYEAGRQTAYVLQRLRPEDVSADRFGGLTIHSEPSSCVVEIDVPLPGGGALTGRASMEGTPISLPVQGEGAHRWAPRLIGPCTATLRSESWAVELEGRGYHDGNASSLGLEALGIRRWIWGRTPHPEGEWIHYLLEPEDPTEPVQNHLLDVGFDGSVEHRFVEVEWGPEKRGRWGMHTPSTLTMPDVGRQVTHVQPFEDGPFYQRWLTRVTGADGEVHMGVGESVEVGRMDRAPFQPLVQMAVHDPAGGSSIWVPLFCGPHQGRWGRLLRHWGLR